MQEILSPWPTLYNDIVYSQVDYACVSLITHNTYNSFGCTLSPREENKRSAARFQAHWHYTQACLCFPDFLILWTKQVLILKAVQQVFWKSCFVLTCKTPPITSFSTVCCEPRPSTTHVSNASLMPWLAAGKFFQMWLAHFRSAHRKQTACWWNEGNPTCRDTDPNIWVKNLLGSLCS